MSDKFVIIPAQERHYAEVLKLNEELVHFLAPLDMVELKEMMSEFEEFLVIEIEGCVAAFLMTFRENANYGYPVYRSFSKKYDEFLYIDRVVVSPKFHGRGLGRLMYEYIFTNARKTDVPRIVAEINTIPLNIPSLEFHKTFGFKEVATEDLSGGKGRVSLQVAEL